MIQDQNQEPKPGFLKEIYDAAPTPAPPAGGWARLEAELASTKSKPAAYLWWMGIAAVALVGIGLGVNSGVWQNKDASTQLATAQLASAQKPSAEPASTQNHSAGPASTQLATAQKPSAEPASTQNLSAEPATAAFNAAGPKSATSIPLNSVAKASSARPVVQEQTLTQSANTASSTAFTNALPAPFVKPAYAASAPKTAGNELAQIARKTATDPGAAALPKPDLPTAQKLAAPNVQKAQTQQLKGDEAQNNGAALRASAPAAVAKEGLPVPSQQASNLPSLVASQKNTAAGNAPQQTNATTAATATESIAKTTSATRASSANSSPANNTDEAAARANKDIAQETKANTKPDTKPDTNLITNPNTKPEANPDTNPATRPLEVVKTQTQARSLFFYELTARALLRQRNAQLKTRGDNARLAWASPQPTVLPGLEVAGSVGYRITRTLALGAQAGLGGWQETLSTDISYQATTPTLVQVPGTNTYTLELPYSKPITQNKTWGVLQAHSELWLRVCPKTLPIALQLAATLDAWRTTGSDVKTHQPILGWAVSMRYQPGHYFFEAGLRRPMGSALSVPDYYSITYQMGTIGIGYTW